MVASFFYFKFSCFFLFVIVNILIENPANTPFLPAKLTSLHPMVKKQWMVFITSQMPLLTTLAFASGKKEARRTASSSALCMGRGRPIRSSTRLDGGARMTT
jgi:hypothetical protein